VLSDATKTTEQFSSSPVRLSTNRREYDQKDGQEPRFGGLAFSPSRLTGFRGAMTQSEEMIMSMEFSFCLPFQWLINRGITYKLIPERLISSSMAF
jgi:hypothetical protein